MKLKNTLIMFLVLVALAAYVYFGEIQKGQEKKKLKAEQEKIFHFNKDSVVTFEVENQYGKFVFRRVDNEWRVIQPLETEADEAVIRSILGNLEAAKKEQIFSISPEDKSQYGLEGNVIRVKIFTRDGKEDSLIFGDKTPVGSNVFAAKVDTLVYTTNDYVKNALDKKLFDWRDKKLLHFKREEIKKLVIYNPYGRFEFEKLSGTKWRLVNIKRPADSGKLSSIISKLEYNRAQKFVDEEGKLLRKYGLVKPPFKVELFLGQEKGRQVLNISRKIGGKYYARDESRKPIFQIDSTLIKELNRPLKEFRDKNFVHLDFDKRKLVDKIVITYGDTTLVTVKDSSDVWYLDEPGKPRIKDPRMRTFMTDLDLATARDFVADDNLNLKKYGLDKPQLNVKLYQGDKLMLEASFGKLVGDKVYAMSSEYPTVYLLHKKTLDNLKLKRAAIVEVEPAKTDSTVASSKKDK